MLQVLKILHRYDDIEPEEILNLLGPMRTRGHTFKLSKAHVRTRQYAMSFRHRTVNTWNALPQEVVTAPNINLFKSRLNVAWKHRSNKFQPSFII